MSHWSLALVTAAPSSEPVVSIDDLKDYLRLSTDNGEDKLLLSLVKAATTRLEERWGRAFVTKTYDLSLDEVPCSTGFIKIPKAPLASVTSITTYDEDNAATVWSTSEYRVDTASEPGRIVCNDAYDWPGDYRTQGGIVVRFTAGYSSQASGVPDGIQMATKALAAHLYEHRGDDGALDIPGLVKVYDDEYDLPEVV